MYYIALILCLMLITFCVIEMYSYEKTPEIKKAFAFIAICLLLITFYVMLSRPNDIPPLGESFAMLHSESEAT